MKTGETLTLSIIDVSRGGAGIARLATGLTVFVPYTITGDVVRARIIEHKKKFASAKMIELVDAALERVIPRCKVFGQCGGCQWQHIPYPMQWQLKLQGIRLALRSEKIDSKFTIEEFPAEQIWNYRNRIQLRGYKDQLGYFAARSHDIVAIDECNIANAQINDALEEIKQQAKQFNKPYKVEIECLGYGEIRWTWNEQHAASGFRQINDEQNMKMKNWIQHTLQKNQSILDLYGGSGNLSYELALNGSEVHCIDISAPLVAPDGSPAALQFHQSDVLPWLKQRITDIKFKLIPEPADSWSAIIDPPRGGLGDQFDDIVERLEMLKVKELIAVGCKTDSWTRDLSRFIQRGWKIQKLAAFDFFPHTIHVESVAWLAKD